MNITALTKLLEKWNEQSEQARNARNYSASMAYAQCATDLGFVLQQITMATQPPDTTP